MYNIPADSGIPLDVTIIDVKSGVFTKEGDSYEPIDIGKGLYNREFLPTKGALLTRSITLLHEGIMPPQKS